MSDAALHSPEAMYEEARALMTAKRLDEALALLAKAIALRPDYAAAHNSRGIIFAGGNRPADALASFDSALAIDPDYHEACNNRGLVLQELGRPEAALASFERAIALKPDNARPHNNRAVALQQLNRLGDAFASFDQAIALKPDYAEAYYNRGLARQSLRDFAAAAADYRKAIALRPDYAEAHNNLGVVLHDLRRPEDAIAAYDKVIALVGDSAAVHVNRSYCYLQLGRFAPGWRLHEWRKRLERPIAARSFAQPLWSGAEDVAGKTVFLHWEQGLGDTLQFCRYAPLVKARGARVVMAVQDPLFRLLRQMVPAIEVVGEDAVPAVFDYHCPLMSLPLAFGTTLDTIPCAGRYIFADMTLRRAWQARLPAPSSKPRIGVVWRGHAQHRNDQSRSIELPVFSQLFSDAADWIALQKEINPAEAAMLHSGRPAVAAYADALSDFSDTAALMDLLDLVITVDTSVAHLAGAMGKPVWILLPYNSDWRWLLGRDDSPWYPSARLFRQDNAGSWQPMMQRLKIALAEFVQATA
jgi:tetratricopeptide (TPR) repeat protein